MAKPQKPRFVKVGNRRIPVSPDSDLSPPTIKAMVEHQVALRDRLGEEHSIGWTPANGSLRAALKAKGLTN